MSGKPGGGGGAGSGPKAAAAAAAAAAVQKQKNLLHRLDAEIANIVDHFTQLVSVSRVNDPPVRNSQDSFQMEVRAARMTQAADSLLKLVSELKQTAMFSGFASLNENVDRRIAVFNQEADSTARLLETIGEQAAASLKELETHYYSADGARVKSEADVLQVLVLDSRARSEVKKEKPSENKDLRPAPTD